jgi:hypothetical protein
MDRIRQQNKKKPIKHCHSIVYWYVIDIWYLLMFHICGSWACWPGTAVPIVLTSSAAGYETSPVHVGCKGRKALPVISHYPYKRKKFAIRYPFTQTGMIILVPGTVVRYPCGYFAAEYTRSYRAPVFCAARAPTCKEFRFKSEHFHHTFYQQFKIFLAFLFKHTVQGLLLDFSVRASRQTNLIETSSF